MVIESCLVYGGFLNGMRVVFSMKHIFTFPPEIWRCFTAFLITGPQLAIIFDPYFGEFPFIDLWLFIGLLFCLVWMYGVALERDSTRFTGAGDFFTYILFVGTFIIVSPCNFLLSITLLLNASSYFAPHISARPA